MALIFIYTLLVIFKLLLQVLYLRVEAFNQLILTLLRLIQARHSPLPLLFQLYLKFTGELSKRTHLCGQFRVVLTTVFSYFGLIGDSLALVFGLGVALPQLVVYPLK